jgi:Activator of Hsp90 ATPase homolog 1-like protein
VGVTAPDPTDEFGTLERRGGVSVLRYERCLAHPRERVWRALTEEADLAAWFPTTIEGDRRSGVPLHFSFRYGEAPAFDGEMLVCVPPALLELRWADDVLPYVGRFGPEASAIGPPQEFRHFDG